MGLLGKKMSTLGSGSSGLTKIATTTWGGLGLQSLQGL